MFTGLVEGQGTVAAILQLPAGLRLTIRPDQKSTVAPCFNASEAAIGDSICISGCCLTVVSQTSDSLDFEAGLETLAKTNLGQLAVGSRAQSRTLAPGLRQTRWPLRPGTRRRDR
jgi:riboflavin synthase